MIITKHFMRLYKEVVYYVRAIGCKGQEPGFSECQYLGEIYEIIRNELELPEWFGANLDALWDAVTGIMYTPAEIRICKTAARSNLLTEVEEIIALFQEAEEKYHEISIVILSDEAE